MTHAAAAPSPLTAVPTWLATLLTPLETWSTRAVRDARLGLDPRDVAQEAVCRMVATYGADRLAATTRPVLRAIAWRALRNLVVDESRRAARLVLRDVLPDLVDAEPLADARMTASRARARLDAALAGLRDGERRFVLAVMQLDSVPAAQRAAGWPRSSPYYHLRLILERLRDAVAEA